MAPGGDNVEITVSGYPARYRAALNGLLKREGGWVNDPADRGGATKFGISLRFLASEGAFDANRDGLLDFDLDMDGDIDAADVKALTERDACELYWRCFWAPLSCGQLPAPLGEAVFDQAVNGGRTSAGKLLQRAINTCIMTAQRVGTSNGQPRVLVDGAIGAATIHAVGWVLHHPQLGMPAMLATFRDAAKERYLAIVRHDPAQQRFLRGWFNRADLLGDLS